MDDRNCREIYLCSQCFFAMLVVFAHYAHYRSIKYAYFQYNIHNLMKLNDYYIKSVWYCFCNI